MDVEAMAEDLMRELEGIEAAGRREIDAAGAPDELEAVRVRYLGRKGRLTSVLRGLGSIDPALRPKIGAEANRVKVRLEAAVEEAAASLAPAATGPSGELDLTLPGRSAWRGARHPISRVIDEICEIFGSLGFTRARGPEAETVWYNFVALNTSLDHPAADEHDTFYLSPEVVLRSHTSPVQIRTMKSYEPPIRILAPGLCYRRDTWDASHAPAFEQVEGLAVDEGITFVDLKAILAEFARQMFGPRTRTRFRPSFFPFTEPSAEVDVTCVLCAGKGCGTCKGTGWIEIMGAGMVDPAVFENVGYDPERYTGYAFGMGPGRIAMLRYGIADIRTLYEGDIRFLEQFA